VRICRRHLPRSSRATRCRGGAAGGQHPGHRGPDAEGVEIVAAAGAVLAFRRLAIIDLATGDQPMSADGTHHLVFNGEIYNYREVRRSMEHEGVRFSNGIRHRGAAALAHALRCRRTRGAAGMFAFGFLDVPGRRLLLARDRLGVKQLYFADVPAGSSLHPSPKRCSRSRGYPPSSPRSTSLPTSRSAASRARHAVSRDPQAPGGRPADV